MMSLLLSWLVSHAQPMPSGRTMSAHFAVTCTVITPRRIVTDKRAGNSTSVIAYDELPETPQPIITADGTVTF